MNILILDNYDSFTYNLVQMVEEIIGEDVTVIKNDRIDLTSLNRYDGIILSPGPGIPNEAGKLLEVIDYAKGKIPILGVCLGHQAIAEVFGSTLQQLQKVYHGVATTIERTKEDALFKGLIEPIQVGRYHSWVVDKLHLSDALMVTSTDKDGIIMSFKHKTMPIYGVQFHPESILTPQGSTMLNNWINTL